MTIRNWGLGGVAALVLVQACSGKINELGDVNGQSGSQSASAGMTLTDTSSHAGDAGSGPSAGGSNTAGAPIGDAGNDGSAIGGDAGAAPEPAFVCPTCQLVADHQNVRAIAVDDTHVVWVDYGTFDAFGNYEQNGRLLMRNLEGGAISVLADSLNSPEDVGLSSNYAFVYLTPNGASNPSSIARIPLSGGPLETVRQLNTYNGYHLFTGAPGYQYWRETTAIYRIADTANAQAEQFVADVAPDVQRLATDATTLYYEAADGIWSKPFIGGAPSLLAAADDSHRLLTVSGGFLYAQEWPAPHSLETEFYVARMPTSGGSWKRVTQGTKDPAERIVVDGTVYYTDVPTGFRRRIARGTVSSAADVATLASAEACLGDDCGVVQLFFNDWRYSRVGIFLTSPDVGLQLIPLDP